MYVVQYLYINDTALSNQGITVLRFGEEVGSEILVLHIEFCTINERNLLLF